MQILELYREREEESRFIQFTFAYFLNYNH